MLKMVKFHTNTKFKIRSIDFSCNVGVVLRMKMRAVTFSRQKRGKYCLDLKCSESWGKKLVLF